MIRLWLAECLSDAGFEVVEVEDGDHAMMLMDKLDTFDLLITDIQMPGRADGNAVATRAKQRYEGLPVIYTSGRPYSLKNEVRICDAFVPKPYTAAIMLHTAWRVLEANRNQDFVL